jgi:purine nucleosidase
MRSLVVAAAVALLAPLSAAGRSHADALPDVIVDHDGAVDDLVALSLLMRSGKVHVRAITITPADSYLEPATRATQFFVDQLGGQGITIAQGHSEGTNPFPADWRKDAGRVLGLPALRAVQPKTVNPIVGEDAAHHLARLLSGPKTYAILETGPLTNIADALRLNPAIKRHISRIYVMGGAVRVRGNVEQAGHDGSAEWNLFNQPRAAGEVIRSGIPITLIPLDATNKVPLNRQVVDRLAAQPSVASQLASESLRMALTSWGEDEYYFWDPLTVAAMLDPRVVTLKTLKIRVLTEGASQGRTVEDPNGAPVEVAMGADRAKVEKMFLDVLGR